MESDDDNVRVFFAYVHLHKKSTSLLLLSNSIMLA